MSIETFLESVEEFRHLDRATLGDLAERMELVEIAAGEMLLRRGDTGDRMFVIVEGEVEVPVMDARDRTRIVARLGPRDVVGEMALLTGMPRSADVVARTALRAYAIRQEDLDPMLRAQPTLARLLSRLLSRRLDQGVGIRQVGKYRVIRRIGRGGTAVVYAAFQEDLNRVVAVKMLSHTLAYDQAFRRRFQDEARTIAALNHPNVVQVHDMVEAYATFFIVMEMLTGKDLRSFLRRTGPLPPSKVVSIVRQIGGALRYAHERGLVHRDVKPANCSIDQRGRVKLMDFGLARKVSVEDRDKRVQVQQGTPLYASPEAARGRVVDGRADIYALGVMTFELLTGVHPFTGATSQDVLRAHVAVEPPDVCSIRPGIPAPLVEFIDGALVKDPDRRLTDWDAIDELLSDGGPTVEGPREERLVRIRFPRSAGDAVSRATSELEQNLADLPGVGVAWADLEAARSLSR